MIKRQRKAILFVLLACLVVLTCTAQRMAGMHALVMNLTADSPSLQKTRIRPRRRSRRASSAPSR